MPQPKTPNELERVDLSILLPTHATDHEWKLEMLGRSSYQRPSLWSRSLSWHRAEVDHGLQVCDEVNWALHAVLQDRPCSPFWLDRALRGLPVGVQGVLFD